MIKKTSVIVLIVLFSLTSINLVSAQSKWTDLMPCASGEYRPCGNDIGECTRGIRVCENNQFGDCQNNTGPTEEICGNQKDDDCNKVIDDCEDNTLGYLLIGSGIAVLIVALILSRVKIAPKDY